MIDTSFYQTNLEPPDKANDPIHDPNVQLLEIPRVTNEYYTRSGGLTRVKPKKLPLLIKFFFLDRILKKGRHHHVGPRWPDHVMAAFF